MNFNKKTIALIYKYSDWLLSFNVFSSFCFSSTKHYSTCEIHMCRVISIKLPWEKQIKKQKKHKIIRVLGKVTQLVAKSLVAVRIRKNSKSKTTTLTYFDNLKKKQRDQGGKNCCQIETFMSLTISNLRTTAFCFENTKLLK